MAVSSAGFKQQCPTCETMVLVKDMRFEIDRTGRTVIVAEEDSKFRLLASETRLERARAWLRRLMAVARVRGQPGPTRRAVPYY